jgi:hypothetical protein
MALYVRRISQSWVGKYTLLHFIQETYNGYPVYMFNNKESLEEHLKKVYLDELESDILQEHVFLDEDMVWFYVADTELEQGYPLKIDFEVKVHINAI